MNNKKILVAPSLLSADFSELAREVKAVERAKADWLHVDVMDGCFVPNLTIGPLVVSAIRPLTKLFFDVHLMIDDPIKFIDEFADAGADLITFHIESCGNPFAVIDNIRKKKCKVGVSIKPGTSVSAIEFLLDKVDLVLIMTVEPGFGGQSFMADCLKKVEKLRKTFKGIIEVDGGVNKKNAPDAISAGVDVLVAGTAVFGQRNYLKAIKALKG